jgi:hypothetical protein
VATPDGQQYGPYREEVIIGWIQEGRLFTGASVWCSGMADWTPLESTLPFSLYCGVVTSPPVGTQVARGTDQHHSRPPLWKPQPGDVQTIEKTSKKWKLRMLVGCFISVVGIVVVAVGVNETVRSHEPSGTAIVGSLMVVGGILIFVIAKLLAWWHHG